MQIALSTLGIKMSVIIGHKIIQKISSKFTSLIETKITHLLAKGKAARAVLAILQLNPFNWSNVDTTITSVDNSRTIR